MVNYFNKYTITKGLTFSRLCDKVWDSESSELLNNIRKFNRYITMADDVVESKKSTVTTTSESVKSEGESAPVLTVMPKVVSMVSKTPVVKVPTTGGVIKLPVKESTLVTVDLASEIQSVLKDGGMDSMSQIHAMRRIKLLLGL